MGAFSVYFGDGRWQEGRRTVGGVWSVGSSLASGSRELLAECGLSGQVWRVGQENCWRSVVCRGEIAEWVKKIVGGVWSVGAKRASGSRGLLAECGLSGQVWRVGQRNCRQSLVCRGEKGEWVKRIVGGVWSVGTSLLRGSKELATACGLSAQVCCVGQENCRRVWSVGSSMASGSRELLAECGLSGQVWRVGQRNCRRSVVCRVKFVAWVKGIVGGVWSVGASMASGSRGLSLVCGLSGRKCCVGQRNCRRVWSVGSSLASGSRELSAGCGLSGRNRCVGQGASRRMWSVGAKRASGSRELLTGVVCRVEKGEWVKKPVAGVWSVGVKTASEPKKPHISYAPNVANRHSDQNCQNPQNMIHLL